jgi:SAM-dependent methyltransferase
MVMQQLKRHVKRLLARPVKAAAAVPAAASAPTSPRPLTPPVHKRFLSDQPRRTAAFLQAAKEYVGKLPEWNHAYLYEKPFDRLAGPPADPSLVHALFYQELYQVANLLKAMEIPFGGRVLEVGSGPGWVTEILVGLGYAVDGIEPCDDMIQLAKERVASFFEHHRVKERPHVQFHCCTLEDCTLSANSFDAVFFHAALHHVIDEEKGLAQCFRMLKPGGVLGVSEACWQPGNRALEATLEEEMARYGTLENPFTVEYLDYLLAKHGYVDIERYHGLNGLFPVGMENMALKEAAQFPASASNTLTARKPEPNRWTGPTTGDVDAETRAEIEVVDVVFDETFHKVCLKARLRNRGQTAWLNKPGVKGCVSLSLYQGTPGTPGFHQAACWQRLTSRVLPGQELLCDLVYYLPTGADLRGWQLGMLSAHVFWFSQRGSPPAPVTLCGRGQSRQEAA